MPLLPRFLALFLAGTLTVSALAVEDLPDLGDSASRDLPLNMEKRVGQQIMNEIRMREPAYLDDPDIESYLNELGGRLVAVSDAPGFGYDFFAINEPSINAFAMPGGYIGVHVGLLAAAQTESELAGVLGHEISHVTQRHLARQISESKKLGMASMLAMGLALIAARSNAQLAGAAAATGQAGALSAQLAFSRDFEREADRVGFDVLRKAGFDVRGMSAFFQRLQKATQLYDTNAISYLRTHPLSGERMSDMQNREQQVPYRQVADSFDFHLIRARVRALAGRPAEAVADIERLLEEHKFSSEAAMRYGLSVAQARAGNWAAAEREIQKVRKLRQASPIVERQWAEIRLARGDVDGGLTAYREAMVRYPLNRGLLYGFGQALNRHKRYAEAQRFAEAQLQNHPQELRLHKMRAEAYAGLGRRGMQHAALAEVFAIEGQLPVAIEQLNLAQRAGDANFFEQSAIDSRLRELKRQYAEEQREKRGGRPAD